MAGFVSSKYLRHPTLRSSLDPEFEQAGWRFFLEILRIPTSLEASKSDPQPGSWPQKLPVFHSPT